MIEFNTKIPNNKSIIPYIDIKLFENKGGEKKFVGFTSISLYDLAPKIINNYGNKSII